MRKTALLSGLLVLGLLAPGCQRLNDERTVSVNGYSTSEVEYDPPRYDQKVTVTATSDGPLISAYLVKADDKEAAHSALEVQKPPPSMLAGQEKAKEITLEAAIPAKTGFVLMLRGTGKDATVKIKTVGR
jgi:hypothetical protein